jgi:hypothetical protein
MTPADGEPEHPAVELHLIMTDRALADRDDEPAHLIGHGPIPAPIARDLLTADEHTRVWVRRLFTDPDTGDLLATDARRRDFPDTARQFLAARDQICRTPVGRPSLRGRHRTLREGQADSTTKEPDRAVPSRGAPIREADHAVAVSKGGPTDLRNGNGRCTACNLVKDLHGWTTRVDDTGVITTTTPTGHTHHGRPPNPPKSAPWKTRPRIRRPADTGQPALRIEIHWPDQKISRPVSRSSPPDR